MIVMPELGLRSPFEQTVEITVRRRNNNVLRFNKAEYIFIYLRVIFLLDVLDNFD